MTRSTVHADSVSASNVVSSKDASDVMNALGQLNNSIENLESVVGTGETTVDVAVQQLRNLTSVLTEVLANSQGNNTDINQGIYQHIGTFDNCYKGMTSFNTSDRALITVTGFGEALCDTTTDGGGWVVFQRRTDGREDFDRSWADYKSGFGEVSAGGDYWLGLEAIHNLTSQRSTELRVDMVYHQTNYQAGYSTFYVGSESTNYTLSIGGFTGNVRDSFSNPHNNMSFTTQDVDNDERDNMNCAELLHGGWWYADCYNVKLNSLYGDPGDLGIYWYGVGRPITFTEMKLRFID